MKIPENIFLDKIILGERVGIDLGSHAVKAIQVSDSPEGVTVVNAGYKEFKSSEGSMDAGLDSEQMALAIKEMWAQMKIKTGRVRIALSDPAIFIRQIKIPQVSEKELEKAIKWQAEKYISFPLDEAIVDYQNLDSSSPKSSDQRDVILVAVKNEVVNKYLNILNAAKVFPSVIDVSPFAIARGYAELYSEQREEIVSLVDIGNKTTSIIIVKGNALLFVRNTNIGGSHIVQSLGKSQDEENSVFNELAVQIDRSFAFFERDQMSAKIQKIYLCGGGSQAQGLDQHLEKKMGIPTQRMDPFAKMVVLPELKENSVLTHHAGQMMAAFGMAMEE